MKTEISKFGRMLMVGLMLTAGLASCKKDNGSAPTLPDQDTFVMEVETFDDEDTTQQVSGESYSNWAYSALTVGVWNTVLTVTMVVPVAAFYEAFNHQAEYDRGSGKWIWAYDFYVLGVKHEASLRAKVDGSNVNWEMYVTKPGHYSEFLWYTGTSQQDRTGGNWTLYKSPDAPAAFMDITWSKTGQDSNIKYTIVESGAANVGSYIDASIVEGEAYDARYSVLLTNEDARTDIEWNRTTKAGRVKAPHHFGDENYHCWNSSLFNDTCPE